MVKKNKPLGKELAKVFAFGVRDLNPHIDLLSKAQVYVDKEMVIQDDEAMDDKFKEECGVFGISNAKDASALTALGLHALQHRGQEGCGIVTFDGKQYFSEKRFGLVGDNFNKEKVLKNLKGNHAIGHNRYSTTGETSIRNIQPFFADTNAGGIGVAHNGNLTNSIYLRNKLVEEGAIFYTTSDTETIVQLIAKSKRLKKTLRLLYVQNTF